MRKYTAKFVTEQLGYTRRHNAACPFPGKYPLRFLYITGGKVCYNGKFHSGAWNEFKQRVDGSSVYQIYDKAGAVIWGINLNNPNINGNQLMYRYFAKTWVNSRLLSNLDIQSIGPYRVYVDESDGPLERSRFVHYVNSNIAHIRTI